MDPGNDNQDIEKIAGELAQPHEGAKRRRYMRFAAAALGGIPWVGGIFGASAAVNAEKEQGQVNELQSLWLEDHADKIKALASDMNEIVDRLESMGEDIQERIESPNYLSLVRRAFRSWDQAETAEKRGYIRKLLTQAGGTQLCPDDLVRLFIDWIDRFHEIHFRVIAEIYKHKGITRGRIWDNLNPARPREDSAEADLFRMLIRDLSIGGVIRLHRDVTATGQFIKKTPSRTRKGEGSRTMESSFEDNKPLELTGLGAQFIHYTMTELVPRIDAP